MHPQYSRSLDAEETHDILIQENHGNSCDPAGKVAKLVGATGRISTLSGTMGRSLEICLGDVTELSSVRGHQCWIGRSARALTSTSTREPKSCQIIEGRATDHVGHLGLNTPRAGLRNDLSRDFPNPDFYHFATDLAGQRLITDAGPRDGGGSLYLGQLPTDETAPLGKHHLSAQPALVLGER